MKDYFNYKTKKRRKFKMKGDFCFNSVGQGLFYSGFITKNNGEHFSIVYDCGTLSSDTSICKSIEIFNDMMGNKNIDLLIISHFDSDHINHLKKLLEGKTIGVAVIPYFTFGEMLQFVDLSSDVPEKEFYANYVSYFKDKKAIVIELGNCNDEIVLDFETISEHDIESSFHPKKLTLKAYDWEFLFYNIKACSKDVDEYVYFIENLMNETHKEPIEILSDKECLKKIKERTPIKKSNNNSIILYHGPIIDEQMSRNKCITCSSFINETCLFCKNSADRLYILMNNCCPKIHFNSYSQSIGTLLTGDLECFDEKALEIECFIGEKRYLNINYFQVPHHGSECLKKQYNFHNYVISCETPPNKYNHPSPKTICIIEQTKGNIIHYANQEMNYTYNIIFP